jgi:ribosomal protein S6
MAEQNMPATEVNNGYADEARSYEFAFHILPTVAEGEVPQTLEKIKAHITKVGGVFFDEETPERIDLVYPIVRHLEGKNRKFTSSYFGWVRFTMDPERVESLLEELTNDTAILRHLLIKLTKEEEAHPFRYHEARKSLKMVETVGEGETIADAPVETEVVAPVEEKALDASIERITEEEKEEAKVA